MITFAERAKVAYHNKYHNKHLLFRLPACLGISYCIAQPLTIGPSAPMQKTRGGVLVAAELERERERQLMEGGPGEWSCVVGRRVAT